MIDSFSVGIGITNKCNYNCSHCYSRENQNYQLTYEQIENLLDRIPVHSVNFGTGESYLNKDFNRILELLIDRRIKISITSNGSTINALEDRLLKKIHDIDISIDHGDKMANDIIRNNGSFDNAIHAIQKLKHLGVEVSMVSCMTNKNFSEFGYLFSIVKEYDINLRVNIYKPVHNSNLNLNYFQFWNGVKSLFSYGDLIACSEPVVNTVIYNPVVQKGCNCGVSSFRVRPSGDIVPCVYWGESDLPLEKVSIERLQNNKQFKMIRKIPDFCKECEYALTCGGGCAARRYYNDLNEPDPYCYIYKKQEKPVLKPRFIESVDLIHANYLCTFILK